MTKKHTHEEYATRQDVNWLSLGMIFLSIGILLSVGLNALWNMNNDKTLTQLAEAEGWEIECLEYEIINHSNMWYFITVYCGNSQIWISKGSAVSENVLCYNIEKAEKTTKRCDSWGGHPRIEIVQDDRSWIEETKTCTTYALRRRV